MTFYDDKGTQLVLIIQIVIKNYLVRCDCHHLSALQKFFASHLARKFPCHRNFPKTGANFRYVGLLAEQFGGYYLYIYLCTK